MRRRRKNQKREKAVMFLSSLLVLTALTMTGVYVRERNQLEEEDYVVDLTDTTEDQAAAEDEPLTDTAEGSEQVSSAKVEKAETEQAEEDMAALPWETGPAAEEEEQEESQAQPETEEEEPEFKETDSLVWPVAGNVLINYSMDKPVYFASLKQYKVSPAIVIQAQEGQQISAAAAGVVTEIIKEEVTGNTIYLDIGGGYRTVYGQLANIQVKEGDRVEKGAYLADVAAPTKYYSVEGANVYFALLKDGEPADPMGKLE